MTDLGRVDKGIQAALDMMDDPLPYGIDPNRDTLERLIGHAVTQKIIPEAVGVEHLFAALTRDLVGDSTQPFIPSRNARMRPGAFSSV